MINSDLGDVFDSRKHQVKLQHKFDDESIKSIFGVHGEAAYFSTLEELIDINPLCATCLASNKEPIINVAKVYKLGLNGEYVVYRLLHEKRYKTHTGEGVNEIYEAVHIVFATKNYLEGYDFRSFIFENDLTVEQKQFDCIASVNFEKPIKMKLGEIVNLLLEYDVGSEQSIWVHTTPREFWNPKHLNDYDKCAVWLYLLKEKISEMGAVNGIVLPEIPNDIDENGKFMILGNEAKKCLMILMTTYSTDWLKVYKNAVVLLYCFGTYSTQDCSSCDFTNDNDKIELKKEIVKYLCFVGMQNIPGNNFLF
uniref:Uncharacterized protein n=2 Tax=Panagrolaimus sp. JU765 TaxID=591449 RepID=A0AC34RPX5_9BILA